MMGATLANGGVNPLTKKQVMPARHVPELLAIMATAGFYDESGDWMYTAGLPAKTGVGGGIVAVVPGPLRHRGLLAAAERGRQQRPFAERHPRHRRRARRRRVRAESEIVSHAAGAPLSCIRAGATAPRPCRRLPVE